MGAYTFILIAFNKEMHRSLAQTSPGHLVNKKEACKKCCSLLVSIHRFFLVLFFLTNSLQDSFHPKQHFFCSKQQLESLNKSVIFRKMKQNVSKKGRKTEPDSVNLLQRLEKKKT